ncbi:MAG TPA: aldehyde dehydrogenase family protein [Acidimicrobiales bacterium]|nr:aldehyde dehydrogenase family protein [Acidimicrobiales bacterium]
MPPTFRYAPALEPVTGIGIPPRQGLLVDGRTVDPFDGTTFTTVNPATGEVLSELAAAGRQDVDRAVAAARAAHEGTWWARSGPDRVRSLRRLADLVRAGARELAVLESLDTGTPVRVTRHVHLPLVAADLAHHAGWADKLDHAGVGAHPRPAGVAALVLPATLPLPSLARMAAPALAAGDALVLKPAAGAPLTALAFADACRRAGLPPGVVNVLTGGAGTGRALVGHPGVDLVAVAGPVGVGRAVAAAVAGTGRRLVLALTGTLASVVLDDAPLDQAVEGVVEAAFVDRRHHGHHLLVQESVARDVLDRLRRAAARLRVGDPLDRNTDVGPVNGPARLEGSRRRCAAHEAAGAESWSPPCDLPSRGWWLPPTVVVGSGAAPRGSHGEPSGPVLTVQTFRTPAEALEVVAAVPEVRAAAVWTDKGSRALWLARRLGTDVAWANAVDLEASGPVRAGGAAGAGLAGGHHGPGAYLAAGPPPVAPSGTMPAPPSPAVGPPSTPGGGAPFRSAAAAPSPEGPLHPPVPPATPSPEGPAPLPTAPATPSPEGPLHPPVPGTTLLYVGGAFRDAGSGRSDELTGLDGRVLCRVARAGQPDAHQAVAAARAALPAWSATTAAARAPALYRVGDVLAGRRRDLAARLAAVEGDPGAAEVAVGAAVDRWTWCAGWSDKLHHLVGTADVGAGSRLDVSVPAALGVVAVVAPPSSLPGLVSVVAAAVATGNACVVVADRRAALTAAALAEAVAASDLPAGTVNVLTGEPVETARWLAVHPGVDALDLAGVTDPGRAGELERAAAERLRPVLGPVDRDHDWAADPGLGRLTALLRTRTVSHPLGG